MPAKKIRTYKDLEEAVLKPTAKGMVSAIARIVADKLYQNIKETIYDHGTPAMYKRTRQFLRSIKIEKATIYSGKIAQAKIVFDYSKIVPIEVRGYWNKHMDVKGNPFNKGNLVAVLEHGTIGSRSYYEREGAHFLWLTKKWLQSSGVNAFSVADVTSRLFNPNVEDENTAESVPVGIRIRKRI